MELFIKDLANKKAARSQAETALLNTNTQRHSTKKDAMLKLFVQLGDRGMSCFEAVLHHDYVLRSTVSDIKQDFGIMLSSRYEKIPNAFGKFTDCKRYWLDEHNLAKAIAHLGGYKMMGGM